MQGSKSPFGAQCTPFLVRLELNSAHLPVAADVQLEDCVRLCDSL